jgi:hypothetical protein
VISALVEIAILDDLDRDAAVELLQPCCPGRRWASEVVAGRPYASMREILTASDDVLADLSWSDVAAAMLAYTSTTAAAPEEIETLRCTLHAPSSNDLADVRAQLRHIVRLALVTTLH